MKWPTKNGKNKSKEEPLPDTTGITTPLTKLANSGKQELDATLSKLSLPLTLNQYYAEHIENIHDCLLFLERFSEEDSIKGLIEAYKKDKSKFSTQGLDLDALAEAADLSKGEFRRLINSTLDLLCDEEALMLLRLNKASLVKKSIQIALDDKHPDSYLERKSILEYYGYKLVNKNAGVVINNQVTNASLAVNSGNTNNVVAQLPSFSDTVIEGEKLVTSTMKEALNETLQLTEGELHSIEVPIMEAELVEVK